jgi:subtilase family serine protease
VLHSKLLPSILYTRKFLLTSQVILWPFGNTIRLILLAVLVVNPPLVFDAGKVFPVVSSFDGGSALPETQHPIVYHPSSLTTLGAPPFTPFEIRKAYNFLKMYSRGVEGNGTRIAIIDAFGDPTLSSDLQTFDSLTGLSPATINIYYPDGVPRQRNSGWAVETALDVEWAHAIAPAATIDLVIAVNAGIGSIFDAISFVANSLPNNAVLSMSFGLSESLYPTTGSFTIAATHQLFLTITSHGTTPVASSGDSGASSCCNIQYPSSDPLVTAVGGTTLTLNSTASYVGETTWSGSVSGSSIIFAKPTYQQGLGDSMRDAVDVSYDADPNTGLLVVESGSTFQVGGTSAGAPQWAALIALANQANSQKYGAINSKLYKLATYHDITVGSDGFFSASKGWDYPTGLGTPDATSVVTALSPSIQLTISNNTTFRGVSVSTSGTLIISPANLNSSGTITVTAKNSTTGATLFTKTYTILTLRLQNSSSVLQGSFLLNIPVLPYNLSSGVRVAVAGGTATGSVLVTRQVDFLMDGTVDLLDASAFGSAWGSSIGSSNYNPRADFNADGSITLLDASIIGSFWQAHNFI